MEHRHGFGQMLPIQRLEGQHRQRHPDDANGNALQHGVPQQRFFADIQIKTHQPKPGRHHGGEAYRHANPRVPAANQESQRKANGAANAAKANDFPDHAIRIAGILLQQRWQQHNRREIHHAIDEHKQKPDGVIPIQQQAQIQKGLLRRQAMRDKNIKRQGGNEGFDNDLIRFIPIQALPA